ncbi:MAG: 30S ribosomal protein S21 [Chlamydiota bacterium]|nr:30S ribosomal protein S21 [Chlamydiota bacterium]
MPGIRVRLKVGEQVEKALRSLKKKVDKEGVLKTLKAKRHYQKPSVRKRLKSKMAAKYRIKKSRT